MSSTEPASTALASVPVKSRKDPAWEYAFVPSQKHPNNVGCNFCKSTYHGGITRLKQHLAGLRGQVSPCTQVPQDVRDKIKAMLEAAEEKKISKEEELNKLRSQVHIAEGDDGEEDQVTTLGRKKPLNKGPLDRYRETPEQARGKGKKKNETQTTLNAAYKLKEKERAYEYIADWFYQAGIPLNAIRLDSFDLMLEAVGQYGPRLKKPSPYQLGTPLLENRVRSLDEYANAHKEAWASTGCSILTDAWTDRRGRSLMNLVAHSARGVWFLRAEDASADVHDAKYIYSFVQSCINEIGPEKVVQVVTDNASNNMAAAKLLKQKYPQIFWTPCAAHTIDLMLEDIGKKPTVHNTIKKAKSITTYIYAHTRVLSIMRSFTGDRDLVRAGTTRFATCYLNLKSLYDKRKELKEMFGSTKWIDSRYSKQKAGNDIAKLVMGNDFWSSILRLINYFEPLAFVLRRVDGDVAAMGYLYGDLQNAKKEIAVRFNGNAKKYGFVCDIIDARWNDKLKTPLHKAGYYLNPFFYYENKTEMEEEVFVAAIIQCASRVYHDDDKVQDMIVAQLNMYTNGTDSFGTPMAIRQRKSTTITPASWWAAHGTDAKELRKLAIKILNLTCSSSACERNWSAFERVHSKKRTRLTQKRLNSLVYVMFNKRLQWKYSQRNRDPLAIKFVDDEPANDWLEEEVSVEGLHQANVTEEQDGESDCDVEQDEPSQGGGNEKKRAPTTGSSRRSKRARNMEPEEESSDDEEEDDTTIPLMDDSSSDDGENDANLHDGE